MKTILLTLFILITCSAVYSQTILKPLPLSQFPLNAGALDFEDTTVFAPRTQSHFLIGWQWAGPNANTNKRLHCNFYQSHYGYSGTRDGFADIPDSGGVKYIVWQHLLYPPPNDAVFSVGDYYGFHFDPVAPTVLDESTVLGRTGDTTGAILGFGIRNSVYGKLDTSGANFNRYSLNLLSFNPLSRDTGIIVLSKPVLDSNYYQVSSDDTSSATSDVVGRRWYLSMNLRRTFSTDTVNNNDIILSIKIPTVIKITDTTFAVNTIRFDKISMNTPDSAYQLPYSRGLVMPLRPTPSSADSTEFVITRQMIPKGNATDRDITLSAFFSVKTIQNNAPANPILTYAGETPPVGRMTKMGIDVRYHGRANVSIDWIRVATPRTEDLVRGYQDSILWALTKFNVQVMRDTITGDSVKAGRNMRLMGFYGKDEPPLQELWGFRYARYLMAGRYYTEALGSPLQKAMSDVQQVWLGGSTGVDYYYVPTPYLRWGNAGSRYWFYLKNGWYDPSLTNDKGTAYETNLSNLKIKKSDSSSSSYYKKFPMEKILSSNSGYNPGLLGCYEGAVYSNYYLGNFTYADKPWWTNIWGTGAFFEKWNPSEANRDIGIRYKKPLTGEEMRSQIWTPILHGAKGIMYDRMYSDTMLLRSYKYKNKYAPFDSIPVYCDTCSQNYGKERIKFQGMMYDKTQIPSSLEGTSLIESDAAGSDFLRTGDRTHLDLLLNLDRVADSMQISHGRVYFGRKSMRREVMKAHDFISANDSILMKMKLVSWFGKGFYILKTGDTASFNKFVALDTHRFATRPPYRTHYDSTTQKTLPYYEDSDSTFYDVMLHRLGTIPLDSMFILGVMNRHTSPLLTGYDYVNNKDTSYFITTSEFDSLVQWHPEKKYTQAGAREITIPFNYKDTNGRFALLHVKELGGGLDTIVGQDNKLAINFLPGEGKIFRVEIVRPNEVKGELAYTNQTKIVAYPKMSHTTGKWLETDTIVHYMAYHKPINDTGIWTGVYFRKSKPSTKHMNTAAIQWESPEYFLTHSVYHDSLSFVDCDTCAYPSIVTRFDSVSQEYRSFVVYGCISNYMSHPPTPSNYQYIIESVVRVRNDSVIGDYQGRSIGTTIKHDLSEWGTPMVNASDSVNFYCWSNFESGIMAGWKRPDTGQLVGALLNIHWVASCTSYTAQHPSMNPYSRFMRGEHENDCALVWQENIDCGGYYHPKIFYTRLHIDDFGQIRKGLSPQYITDTSMAMLFNADSSIFCASVASPTNPYDTYWNYEEHSFPVVYRDVFYADTDTNVCNFEAYYPGYKRASLKFDRLYWQFLNPLVWVNYAPLTKIKHRLVRLVDTVLGNTFTPLTLDIAPLISIWHSGYILDQPVVSAGDGYDYSYFPDSVARRYNCFNYSHRAVNLNFRSRPPWYHSLIDNGIIDTLAQIFHFPQEVFVELTDQSVSTVDVGLLSNAHLVERGSLTAQNWQKNNRIYNKRPNQEALPVPSATIRSSGQYYFRTATQPTARRFYGFGDDSLSFGVSSILIDEKEYALKEELVRTPFEKIKLPDTLSTDWFTIDNIETMDAITTGTSSDRLSAWLERRNDGATWDVPLTAGEQMKINRETIELENGDNQEYRIRIRSNNYAPYHSETAITDNEDGGYGKRTGSYSVIDLGAVNITKTVFVFPNPARDEINLLIKGTERSEVIIVSALGDEAVRFFAEGGKTVTVNTSTFPSGMYAVRVRRGTASDIVVPFVVFR